MPHAFGLDIDDRFCAVAGSIKPLVALSLAEERLAARSSGSSIKGSGGSSARGASAGSKQPTNGGEAPAPAAEEPAQATESPAKAAGSAAHAVDPQASAALREALLARLRFRRSLHEVSMAESYWLGSVKPHSAFSQTQPNRDTDFDPG